MVEPFINQAKLDGRKLIYVHFGRCEPLLKESQDVKTYHIEAQKGFESFAIAVHKLLEQEGRNTMARPISLSTPRPNRLKGRS
jgi:hypothetical protein